MRRFVQEGAGWSKRAQMGAGLFKRAPIGLGGHLIGAAERALSGQESTGGYERWLTQEGADRSRTAPRSDSQELVKHEVDVEQLRLCSIEGGVD